MFAKFAPGAHLPMAGVFSSWSHATIPNEFLNGARMSRRRT